MSNQELLLVYKLATILTGLVFLFVGWDLFRRGVYRGGAELETKGLRDAWSINLGKGGPGLVFAALGAAIVLSSVYKGFKIAPTSTETFFSVTTPTSCPPCPEATSGVPTN